MAALTITVANLVASSPQMLSTGKLGETVTAGKVIYQDPADGLWYLAD